MISEAYITEWRNTAPWPDDIQVEQDLILSRILVDIFSNNFLRQELAFRGGTALHKLFMASAARYSEDIDLVRTSTGKVGPIADALREILQPWLGKAKSESTANGFKLYFKFSPGLSTIQQKIKIEINILETFSIIDRIEIPYQVNSSWFSGQANINTFHLDELIATKIRALYQRSKGRDLFDLWMILREGNLNVERSIEIFQRYMDFNKHSVSRKEYEENLHEKLSNPKFMNDIIPLISPNLLKSKSKHLTRENDSLALLQESEKMILTGGWDLLVAANYVKQKIISKLN